MDEIAPNVLEARIPNSEDGRIYSLYIRSDRLAAFQQFMESGRHPEHKSSPMPGASWAVILGLDAIFYRRPRKFPVADVIAWLAKAVSLPAPPATKDEIELALEGFAALYPPDAAGDA